MRVEIVNKYPRKAQKIHNDQHVKAKIMKKLDSKSQLDFKSSNKLTARGVSLLRDKATEFKLM